MGVSIINDDFYASYRTYYRDIYGQLTPTATSFLLGSSKPITPVPGHNPQRKVLGITREGDTFNFYIYYSNAEYSSTFVDEKVIYLKYELNISTGDVVETTLFYKPTTIIKYSMNTLSNDYVYIRDIEERSGTNTTIYYSINIITGDIVETVSHSGNYSTNFREMSTFLLKDGGACDFYIELSGTSCIMHQMLNLYVN